MSFLESFMGERQLVPMYIERVKRPAVFHRKSHSKAFSSGSGTAIGRRISGKRTQRRGAHGACLILNEPVATFNSPCHSVKAIQHHSIGAKRRNGTAQLFGGVGHADFQGVYMNAYALSP